MELSNALQGAQNETKDSGGFHCALVVLCKLLAPMAPHISSELWEGGCGARVTPSLVEWTRHGFLAAFYQLVQTVLNTGVALIKRGGTRRWAGIVTICHAHGSCLGSLW